MFRYLGIGLACVLTVSPALASDEGIPEKKLDELKAATVYVKVEGKEGTVTGSGFLILVDGETGYVATNRHVVAAVPGRFTPRKYSLVFWSGSKKEQILPAEVVGSDPEPDLAVLKVTSKNLPAPLDLSQKVKLRETMTVYTFGFPLGALLSPTKTNPAITIGKGTISSLREDGRGKLKQVQLDGELNPGNSGGPVVDGDGHLVGIAVAKIVGTKISFAIPPAELTDLLKGRAAPAVIRSLSVENGVANLEIEVPLIDPLHKLKAVELRHVSKDTLKEAPTTDKDDNWPNLPGAEKIDVKIDGGKAIAQITLKGPEKKSFDWFFQTTYINAEGQSVATQPLRQGIDFGATGVLRLNGTGNRLWETVHSKEGQFTVDMPVKPAFTRSSTRKVVGGTMKVLLLGCETENGLYLAFRLDLPTPVAKGSEEQVLNAERDAFAAEWNGKVMSEKKVIARGNVGRDFTIQGKLDEDGMVTMRMRLYLVGKSIFAVAVTSPPTMELPQDAGRFLGSLALGDEKIRASGTPEPELKGTELKGWGLAIDPDKDCKFTPGNKAISFDVPGTLHDLFFDGGPTNAPRVMREVEGDFVVTVKVAGEFKPGPKSTNPKSVPYHGAGILLWSDSDNNIRFERFAFLRAGRITTGVAFQEREGGYSGANHNESFKAGDCYLRLERKGSRIHGAISSDGTAWKQLKPIDTVWPDKLKVGLTAITTSSEPFSVKFEEFDLKAKGSGTEEGQK